MKKFIIVLSIFSLFLGFFSFASAQQKPLDLYLFYSDGCPHCANIEAYIQDKLIPKYPNLVVHKFEISHNEANRTTFYNYAGAYGITSNYVPTLFIGEQSIVGEEYDALASAVELNSKTQAVSPEEKVQAYLAAQNQQTYQQNTNNQPQNNTQNSATQVIGWIVILALLGSFSGLIYYKYFHKAKTQL